MQKNSHIYYKHNKIYLESSHNIYKQVYLLHNQQNNDCNGKYVSLLILQKITLSLFVSATYRLLKLAFMQTFMIQSHIVMRRARQGKPF